jgi:hypothetical protein
MTLQYVDHIYCKLFLCWIWHCRAPADVFACPLLRPLQTLNRLFNAARFPALLCDSLLDKGGIRIGIVSAEKRPSLVARKG